MTPMAAAKKTASKKSDTKKKAAPAKKAATKKAPAKKSKGAKVLMTSKQVKDGIKQLADAVVKEFPSPQGLVVLGIRTRGVTLATRLKEILDKKYKVDVATGVLDITFYRDDLSRLGPNPMVRGSDLPFDIHDANIVLVDDVLFTGRTVRAALDEISDFGRPAVVRLAIFVDRGMRELPIQADYCVLHVKTKEGQRVSVRFEETDSEDKVLLDEVTNPE